MITVFQLNDPAILELNVKPPERFARYLQGAESKLEEHTAFYLATLHKNAEFLKENCVNFRVADALTALMSLCTQDAFDAFNKDPMRKAPSNLPHPDNLKQSLDEIRKAPWQVLNDMAKLVRKNYGVQFRWAAGKDRLAVSERAMNKLVAEWPEIARIVGGIETVQPSPAARKKVARRATGGTKDL